MSPLVQAPLTPDPSDTNAAASPPVGKTRNRLVASALSVVLPGAGQIYNGEERSGVGWLGSVVSAYVGLEPSREWSHGHHVVLGFVLHLACIAYAYRGPERPSPVIDTAVKAEREEAAHAAAVARAEEQGARVGRAAAESLRGFRRQLRRRI